MKYWILLIVLMFVLTSFGCYTHIYYTDSRNTDARYSYVKAYKKWHAHWFFGLIDTNKELDISAICRNGKGVIKDERSFGNLVVSALIGIVYSPTTVTVYCQSDHEDELLKNIMNSQKPINEKTDDEK